MDDPYKILNVSRNSSDQEIKEAYRKLALKYHPDRNINNKDKAEEMFKKINSAYVRISNKDNLFSSFEYGFKYDNIFNDSLNFSNLLNNFKNMKKKGFENITSNLVKELSFFYEYYHEKNMNNSNSTNTTDHLTINANIELFDIYNSIPKEVKINRMRKCLTCYGMGFNLENKLKKCETCHGYKYISKEITLKFNAKYKTITFHKQADEEHLKKTGNIYLNILPKAHDSYQVINAFDLLYTHNISFITSPNYPDTISIQFKHLDNKTYQYTIENPIPFYWYTIENMGLPIINKDKRGNLYLRLNNTDIVYNKKTKITPIK